MRFLNPYIGIFFCCLFLLMGGCGDEPDEQEIILTGTLGLPPAVMETDAPVLVAVTNTVDADVLNNQPAEAVIDYVTADKDAAEFRVDLTERGVRPGDEVFLVAFVDNNYTDDVPFPDEGDMIGIYVEEDRITPGYELQAGENTGIHIDITREVFDFDAEISGEIQGDETGSVVLVAYAGAITSSDFTAIDFDAVIGYETLDKRAGPVSYTLNILPYGKNVPIENVQVFALLDKNNSETVDPGDKIGFFSQGEDFSTPFTVTEGETPEIDLEFKFTVDEPSGDDLSISGSYRLPAGEATEGAPVYIAVFDGEDAESVLDDPFAAVRYFERIPAGETEFTLDLANTGLAAGDEVILIGFWDRDYNGAIPALSVGDVLGVYAEAGRITPAIDLVEGGNTGVEVNINREVFDYEASISGAILGNDAGPVTLVAYAGEITSSDFTALDFDQVVGFTTVTKEAGATPYTLDILPYGKDVPIENVQVFALLDANNSETVDPGDKIGFFSQGEDFSTPFTVTEGETPEIDLEFKFTVDEPSGDDLSISGSYRLPAGEATEGAPVYIAVFDGEDAESVLDDPFAAVRYFERIPAGETEFTLDLANTGLAAGDEVILIGFWDRDYNGAIPALSVGDVLGVYAEAGRITPAIDLVEGGNTGVEVNINREVFDYEASISGAILGNDAGPVTLVAYAGEITSSDFTALDFDQVVGFTTVTKEAGATPYTLDILPYGKDVPIENVQVFALLDANRSGAVDGGDKIGFFGEGDQFSTPITIPEGRIGDIDIQFKFEVDEPSGFDISIAGTVPGTANRTKPVYITVFDSDNPNEVVEDPFAGLKFFYKVPPTVVNYCVDLSNTDIYPGDEVLVAALRDNDFAGGFPEPSRGDKLGIVQNKETYEFTAQLNCGTNVIPPPDFDFQLNKNVFEFDASIEYGLDLTDAGSFGQESRIIVLTIHVDGVDISVAASGQIDLNIDIDYLLGVDILPATAYDFIGIDVSGASTFSPVSAEYKQLPILTAIYEKVLVKEDSQQPEPLIKGYDHGEEKERTAYLVAILDKNGNTRLDMGDEIGYYSRTRITVNEDDERVIELPCCPGEIVVPDWFTGILHFPTPIPRITKGVNRETRSDGAQGPYWISNFIEP